MSVGGKVGVYDFFFLLEKLPARGWKERSFGLYGRTGPKAYSISHNRFLIIKNPGRDYA